MDLAEGHEKALGYLEAHPGSLEIFNLGTGKGTSVLELVHAFSEATGVEIPDRMQPRRPGDIDAFYADASRAKAMLGWQAARGLEAVSYTHLDVYKRQDFAIIEGLCHSDKLVAEPLMKDRLVFVCGKDHPLYETASISPNRLREFRFLLRDKGSGTDVYKRQGEASRRLLEHQDP